MYNGHIRTDTHLHMDVTDAVNIAMYMEGQDPDADSPYALWLLWSRDDREALRRLLRECFNLPAVEDPINSHNVRITEDLLAKLTRGGIRPYIIHQRVNQAIIIPALTPHYVRRWTNDGLSR